jgi:hypothetical protein
MHVRHNPSRPPVQVFSDNMKTKSKPQIKDCKEDWTKITFSPDLAKFGMEVTPSHPTPVP